jgi:hypothetical protein
MPRIQSQELLFYESYETASVIEATARDPDYFRVNLDLWYAVPPTKGGHSYGHVTVRRSPDPPDRGTRFDQSHPR